MYSSASIVLSALAFSGAAGTAVHVFQDALVTHGGRISNALAGRPHLFDQPPRPRRSIRSRLAVAAVVPLLTLTACTPPTGEMRAAVEDFGFTDVQIQGVAWWGCSKDDTFERKWTAVTAAGRPVRGVVCGGFGKGWTVRITGRSAAAAEQVAS